MNDIYLLPYNIYKVKNSYGYKIENFAKEIKADGSYSSSVQCGSKPLSFNHFVNICIRFNLSADWLLYGTNNPFRDRKSLLDIDIYNRVFNVFKADRIIDYNFISNASTFNLMIIKDNKHILIEILKLESTGIDLVKVSYSLLKDKKHLLKIYPDIIVETCIISLIKIPVKIHKTTLKSLDKNEVKLISI